MNIPEKQHEVARQAHEEFKIFVNAREKTVTQDKLSFDEVVVLAFGPPNYDSSVYTVTYRKGEEPKPQGTLVQGESVRVKSGMIFNVVRTDRS